MYMSQVIRVPKIWGDRIAEKRESSEGEKRSEGSLISFSLSCVLFLLGSCLWFGLCARGNCWFYCAGDYLNTLVLCGGVLGHPHHT